MKLDLKVIVLGGLVYYVVQFLVSMLTQPFVHEGVLLESYIANAQFWRPELSQDPPDTAALLPRWVATGIVAALIQAAIYDNIRSALNGPAWLQGAKFGVIVCLFLACFSAVWSGICNLPENIWLWWNLEALAYLVIGGTALGVAVAKLSKA